MFVNVWYIYIYIYILNHSKLIDWNQLLLHWIPLTKAQYSNFGVFFFSLASQTVE